MCNSIETQLLQIPEKTKFLIRYLTTGITYIPQKATAFIFLIITAIVKNRLRINSTSSISFFYLSQNVMLPRLERLALLVMNHCFSALTGSLDKKRARKCVRPLVFYGLAVQRARGFSSSLFVRFVTAWLTAATIIM